MEWWMLAAAAAFFVKGLCGFANTLVFTTILSFGNSNVNISPVELLLGYPTNIIIVYRERGSIDWKICLPLSLLVIAGSLPGILLLKNADAGVIKIVFGFLIIIVGIEMLLREYKTETVRKSTPVLALLGILSGLLCGLYGVGALLGAYVSRVTQDNHSFKANICIVFLFENTLRIMVYAVCGILTQAALLHAVKLLPFMLAGLCIGIVCSQIMTEEKVKKTVIVMLILSGLALVMKNLPQNFDL